MHLILESKLQLLQNESLFFLENKPQTIKKFQSCAKGFKMTFNKLGLYNYTHFKLLDKNESFSIGMTNKVE